MSPVVVRPASTCWFAQPNFVATIGMVLLLAELVPGGSYAQGNSRMARDDTGGPMVVIPSQRGPSTNPSGAGGPVVIPAFEDQPPPARDQAGDRVDRQRSRQQELATTGQRTRDDGDRRCGCCQSPDAAETGWRPELGGRLARRRGARGVVWHQGVSRRGGAPPQPRRLLRSSELRRAADRLRSQGSMPGARPMPWTSACRRSLSS